MGPVGGGRWVQGAHPGCESGGCQFGRGMAVAEQAMEIVNAMGKESMSQALWCDQGGHAFSERDPGRQRITIDVLDEDTDREIKVSKDYCGECAREAGLTTGRKTNNRAAIPGKVTG